MNQNSDIDIVEHSILNNYPQVDWKKVKGLRDIITHYYIDINADGSYFQYMGKQTANIKSDYRKNIGGSLDKITWLHSNLRFNQMTWLIARHREGE